MSDQTWRKDWNYREALRCETCVFAMTGRSPAFQIEPHWYCTRPTAMRGAGESVFGDEVSPTGVCDYGAKP